jgi:hypothetical protein
MAEPNSASPASDGFIPSHSDDISLFPDPAVDNVVHVLIALGAEFWALRRRMFVLEKVLEKAGVSTADVEAYRPSAAEKAEWAKERDVFIARTFAGLSRSGNSNDRLIDTSRDEAAS